MIYQEPKPVEALAWLYAWTKAVIASCAGVPELEPVAALDVNTRGDVDDYSRFPQVTAQIVSALPTLNGHYGAAIRMRCQWVFHSNDTDEGQVVGSAFMRAAHRAWRNNLVTPEGWASYFQIVSDPVMIANLSTTADFVDYAASAIVIARTGEATTWQT